MPRLPRKFVETSFFHVICQGINKSYIFDYKDDIEKYIHFMYKLNDEYNIKIIAYCVMNNHVHLLLEFDKLDNLSSYMHRLNTKYANYYNKKYNRVGFVFRNRFKSEAIFDKSYLYNCINYIFNNPVKAHICQYPTEYPYSNIKEYIESNGNLPVLNNTNYTTFLDIDEDKEKRCKEIIDSFLNIHNRSLSQVLKNIELLKDLISILDNNNVSFLMMEKNIGINRKRLKKILCDNTIT